MSTELESDYRKDRAKHSGNKTGYSVEARCDAPRPVQIGNQIFDNRWREVKFQQSKDGVGVPDDWNSDLLREFGLYGYAQAQSLRWWLHAAAEATLNGTCLDSRLIKHTVSYSQEAVAESQHCVIGGDDRSNFMPDWGKKSEVSK